ncbi:MAG: c-type cytochrome [Granulosicoccaceae bacterium]
MLKRTTVLSLITLALLAGCGKEEPKEAPAAPEAAMPETAPMEAPAAPEPAMPEAAPMEETAAPEATMPEVAPMEPAPSTEAAMPAPAAADTAQGKKVYDGLCFSCHTAGIAGAPKLGDKAAWAARIDQGMDTLYAHSINGFQGKSGVMPPKGGNMSLSDDEVKAAVDYMVAQSQ